MLTSFRALGLAAAAVVLGAGCHAVLGLTDYEVTDTTSGTGAAAGVGGSVPCSTPSDCPGQDTGCGHRQCLAGQCVPAYEPQGTSCSEGEGQLCDGAGHCVECLQPDDCTPPATCAQNQCVTQACANAELDGNETDVDCGGSDCPPCDNGATCLVYGDCVSQFCDHGGGTGGAGGSGGGGAGGAAAAGGAGGAAGQGGAPGPGTCAPCGAQADCAPAPSTWCDPTEAGGACVPNKPDGDPCTADYECANGSCPADDLVCCDQACDRPCESCLGAKTGGQDGTCQPVTAGEDPDGECLPDPPCVPLGVGCNGDAQAPGCDGPCASCDSLFGAVADVFEVCSETTTACLLRARTVEAPCGQICGNAGVDCVHTYSDEPNGTCGIGQQLNCWQGGANSQLCLCARSCGSDPPCAPPLTCLWTSSCG